MTHLSLDNLGQTLVSPYGGVIQQPQTVQVQDPAPGPDYVQSWDAAQGKYVWKRCPAMPASPNLRHDWTWDVVAIRHWYDAVFEVEKLAFTGWQVCPVYTKIEPAKLALDRAVKVAHPAAMIPRLLEAIWSLVLPGQHDIIGAAALGYQTTIPGLVPGQWGTAATRPEPLRQSAAKVADVLGGLDAAVAAIGVSALTRWPTYIEGLASWVEQGLSGEEIRRRGKDLAQLVKASAGVPWPHGFFSTFLSQPMVDLPPFAAGFRYNDPAITTSAYFPRVVGGSPLIQIQRDIANYIVANDGLLGEHFAAEFARWIRSMEKKIEKAAKKAQLAELVLTIIVGLLTLGAGVIVVASLVVVQLAVGTYHAKQLGDQQMDVIRRIMKALGITQRQMDTFREWLAANAAAMPPQGAPPGPAGIEAETPFSVFVEDTFIMGGADIDELVDKGWAASSGGDRILIKDNATGDVVSVIVHTDSDIALLVPREEIGTAMALPKGAAGAIGEEGISPWLLAIPAAILVVA